MQTLNYWTQFEHTGKVEDYLSYVSAQSPETVNRGLSEVEKREDADKSQAGVNPYAGIHMGNGNDFKTDAYRGV